MLRKTAAEQFANLRKKLLEAEQTRGGSATQKKKAKSPAKTVQAMLIDIGYQSVDIEESKYAYSYVHAENKNTIQITFKISHDDGLVYGYVQGFKDDIDIGELGKVSNPSELHSTFEEFYTIDEEWLKEYDPNDPDREDED